MHTLGVEYKVVIIYLLNYTYKCRKVFSVMCLLPIATRQIDGSIHLSNFCCADGHYVQFRIDNHGEHTVRLRSRHLQFCSAADNRVLVEVPKWYVGVYAVIACCCYRVCYETIHKVAVLLMQVSMYYDN
jgi:hypothetical protein